MPAKKVHPHGLPHLSDAQADDRVDQAQVMDGMKQWEQAIKNGDYSLVQVHEHALDDKHDLLTVVRRKNH